MQVTIDSRSPPPFSRPSFSSDSFEGGRLSFARPTERVLQIHSIDDKEALSRLSVGPSSVTSPAPSFRYSFRSSYRPYQWTANQNGNAGQGRPSSTFLYSTASVESGDSQSITRPSTVPSEGTSGPEAPVSPPPGRPPSPPLHTPERSSLHRRQLSARKQGTERGGSTSLEPRRLLPSSSALITPSQSSPSSSPPEVPHISRTPLLTSSQASSSFSTLPFYRPPTSSSALSPYNTARALTGLNRGEEVKEEVGWDGRPTGVKENSALTSSSASSPVGMAGLAGSEADPSFRAFVSSHLYASYESEVVNNVDLLRRSNALNEDTADYVLILQPDHVTHTHTTPQHALTDHRSTLSLTLHSPLLLCVSAVLRTWKLEMRERTMRRLRRRRWRCTFDKQRAQHASAPGHSVHLLGGRALWPVQSKGTGPFLTLPPLHQGPVASAPIPSPLFPPSLSLTSLAASPPAADWNRAEPTAPSSSND